MANSTNPDIEFVFEKPLEPLDESVHHDSISLVRVINSLIKRINDQS